MRFIPEKWETDFEAICELAFEEAGVGDASPEVTDLFTWSTNADEICEQAQKSLRSAIREKYGRGCAWQGKLRLVPVPELRFDTTPVPQLGIEVKAYLVWVGEVQISDARYSVTLVGVTGKPEVLVLPAVFLQAVLNDDFGRFRILGRSGSYTTREIPGAKPARFCEDFINGLSQTLKKQSLVMWLNKFGEQGSCVAPLLVGSLLGLESMSSDRPTPVGKQAWDEETVINALGSMDYRRLEAEEMFLRAAPKLRAEQTLEEVIRIILQDRGKEE
ncbi:MAG: hypothetical protein PHI12_14945 [Dehalococcoidales bacterium]|nr:hypothetical protein [Dehalococcoidales bacterium]